MKKSIALGLVVCLLMLSTSLYAKERRGADVIVTRTDGIQSSGELIAVKPKSLLLQNAEGGDVSIEISDIREVLVIRKSKAGKGALIGLAIGGALTGGTIAALGGARDEHAGAEIWSVLSIGFIPLGALIGAVAGAASGKDKTIYQGQLSLLRKYARIRNFQ